MSLNIRNINVCCLVCCCRGRRQCLGLMMIVVWKKTFFFCFAANLRCNRFLGILTIQHFHLNSFFALVSHKHSHEKKNSRCFNLNIKFKLLVSCFVLEPASQWRCKLAAKCEIEREKLKEQLVFSF